MGDHYLDADENGYWVCSQHFGTQVAVLREVDGAWYIAPDDSFDEEIGPFKSEEEAITHVEVNRLFTPWGSPGV